MPIRIDEVVGLVERDPTPPPPEQNDKIAERIEPAKIRREIIRLQERALRLMAD